MIELISKERAMDCVVPGQTVVKTVDKIRALPGITRDKLLAGRFHTEPERATEYMRGWNDAIEAIADRYIPADVKEATGRK